MLTGKRVGGVQAMPEVEEAVSLHVAEQGIDSALVQFDFAFGMLFDTVNELQAKSWTPDQRLKERRPCIDR